MPAEQAVESVVNQAPNGHYDDRNEKGTTLGLS